MKEKLELFPDVLIRLSGGSMDELGLLNAKKTNEILKQIYDVRKKINTVKNKINESLYSHISTQADSNVQKELLNLKRDIFNERAITFKVVNAIRVNLTEDIAKNINDYVSLLDEYLALKKKGEIIFNDEQPVLHQHLKKIFQNPVLQKGLLLSSQSLLDRIENYLEKDLTSMRKKEAQTEQGLMKYITRMHAKTSPFSTFTNLTLGKTIRNSKKAETLFDETDISKHAIVSHIRLNNFLYQYIRTLLTKNKNIYQWFLIRPNPTIQNKGDYFLYLTNNNNAEAFQRIPFSPVVELFKDLASEQAHGIGFRELVDLIIKEEYIEATVEELEAYINQLIECGYFEFNIGVSGIDTEWDRSLIEKLQPIIHHDVLIGELIETLQKMQEMSLKYGNASLDERKNILAEAYQIFRDICMKLHEAAGLPADERKPREELEKEQQKKTEEEKVKAEQNKKEEEERKKGRELRSKEEEKKEDVIFKHTSNTLFYFKPEQLFYEDTSIDTTFQLDHNSLEQFVSNVDELIAGMALFEGNFDERQRMKHFFLQKYGTGKTIDLLTFYEDYFRDYKKQETDFYNHQNKEQRKLAEEYKEKEKQAETNSGEVERIKKELEEKTKIEIPEKFKVAAIEERSEKIKQWYEQLGKEYDGAKNKNSDHLIKIDQEIVDVTNTQINHSATDTNMQGSYGMFVQLFEEKQDSGENKLMGVLNATIPGYGKLVSRFLHIFDSSFTDNIRKWNLSLQNDHSLFIEDCDASYFNANLHPPLMPGEVWMPNGHNSLPAEKQVPVTEIAVAYKDDYPNLTLIQKSTGKEIYVFDLGFQGPGGRSQLFQLLDKFSKAKMLSWHPVLSAAAKKEEKKDKQPEQNNTTPNKPEPKKSITIRPRIMMGDQIILQRKAWFIPKELLPLRKNTENDWEYFERVNLWRCQQKMPDEVFIFLYSKNQVYEGANKEKDMKKLSRDDHKPQYICFTNPYLVNLFEKLLSKVPVVLRLEEMLPNTEQLFRFGKKRHIAEFVVQWYKYSE